MNLPFITSLGRFTKYLFSLFILPMSGKFQVLYPALSFISTIQIKYKGSLGVIPAYWSTFGVNV